MLKINTVFSDTLLSIEDFIQKMIDNNYTIEIMISIIEGIEFQLAYIFYTYYELLHFNKELYEIGKQKIENAESYTFWTFEEVYNKNLPLLDKARKTKPWNQKAKSIIHFRKLDFETSEYVKQYNCIIKNLFGEVTVINTTSLLFPERQNLVKLSIKKRFLLQYKNYYLLDEVNISKLMYLLELNKNKIINSKRNESDNKKTENEISKKQEILSKNIRFLFTEFPQFEKDYVFFFQESFTKAPYICETEYGLAWTATRGCLAKYFKSIVEDGSNVKWENIEKVFRVEKLKASAKSESNYQWDDMEKELFDWREKNTLI